MHAAESTGLSSLQMSDELFQAARQRQLRFAFENARFAIFPLVVSILCYSGLLAVLLGREELRAWLLAMCALIGIRLFLVLRYHARGDLERWAQLQMLIMGAIGTTYGITAWWIPLPDQTWLLAVVNLWLGGLAVGGLIGQGIVPAIGLAFAITALLPMMARLLLSQDPTLTALGIGNLLFYMYIYSVALRAQGYTLSEIRHHVMYHALADSLETQRQRSEALVDRLTREVTRRKRIQVALKTARDHARRQSGQDPLTSLANLRTFESALAREWGRAARDRLPVSVVLVDIDRFRAYNERYGHHAGDLCIARLARLLLTIAHRDADLVARFGSEEFAVLLPETGEFAAQDLAEEMRGAVFDLTILHGSSDAERVVTVSCGVATRVPQAGQPPTEIIESAALALKRAKAAGRNCVYALAGSAIGDER
ncbi:MAG: GGDEF domain-containing protein [Gammaproteobacteria bacterium]